MGGGVAQFQGFNRATQGWFDNCNLVTASRNGVFTLVPIETASAGIQVLRVPAAQSLCPEPGTPCFYYIEQRQPIGAFDSDPFYQSTNMARGAWCASLRV
jgi:hypothetical protein